MSLVFSRDATLQQKKHDLVQTVQSRKRKLRQLYAVATAEKYPPAFDLDARASPGLAHFFDANDIEQGRYFDISTLPALPQNAPGSHPPPSSTPSKLPSSHAEQHDAAQLGPVHGSSRNTASPPAADNAPSDASEVSSEHDMNRRTRSQKAANQLEADRPLISQEDISPATPKHAASDVSALRSSRSQKKTSEQPADLQTTPEKRLKLPNGSRPHDSDVDEPSSGLQATSKVDSPRRSGLRDRSAEPKNGLIVSEKLKVAQESSKSQPEEQENGNTDIPSSPSSTAGPKSTNTSGADAHSPATSPDDEVDTVQAAPKAAEHPKLNDRPPAPQLDVSDSKQDSLISTASSDLTNVPPASKKRPASPSFDNQEAPSTSNEKEHENTRRTCDEEPPPSKKSKVSENTNEVFSNGTDDARISHGDTNHNRTVEVGGTESSMRGGGITSESTAARANASVKRPSLSPVSTNITNRRNSSRVTKKSHKRKSTLPTLVFSNHNNDKLAEVAKTLQEDHAAMDGRLAPATKDYMQIMFLRQALNTSFHGDLTKLINSSAKTLTTSDWQAGLREEQDCRIVKQIYKFQDRNRWSYRQLEAATEPEIPKVHQDYLVGEMKWLQADFREERKFKLYMAKRLADWCAEWVGADSAKQKSLQVTTHQRITHGVASQPDISQAMSLAVPAVLEDTELSEDEADPAPIFSSSAELVPLDITEATIGEKALQNIPLLGPTGAAKQSKSQATVSTLLTGQLLQQTADATKQGQEEGPAELPPEDVSCALFDPEWKPLRARVNAYYAFRPPPTAMPPQGFYEYRYPSQWTYEDDQQLRGYVKDFPSNWPLISDRLSVKSQFVPGSDRRTPWECYERLLGMEGPPADANARQWLRYFQYRMDQAKRSFQNQQLALQQHAQAQAQSTGQAPPQIPQKRFPSPVKVERKPSRRFIAMLDAARRLAKKRETKELSQTRQQQQQAQQSQQNQQQHGAQQNGTGQRDIKTPQQFSRMKHEKEVRDQQKLEQYRAQQRKAFEMQRRQQQSANQTLPPNGIAQQMRNNGAPMPNGTNASTHLAVPNPNQVRPTSQQSSAQMQLPNAIGPNGQMNGNVRPQANMQGSHRIAPQGNTQHMSQESIQRYMQQQQQQQQRMQMQGQQGLPNQNQGGSSSPNAGTASMMPFNNPQTTGGEALQSPNILQPLLNGSSPHMSQQFLGSHQQGVRPNQPQTLSSGHTPTVQTLMHEIARNNPNMTQAEVGRQASEQLKNYLARQSRQNALNAAAGLPQPNMANLQGSQSPFMQGSNGSQNSPYQQNGMLASNQQAGARSASPVVPPTSSHGSGTGYGNQQGYQQQLRNQMLSQQHQRQNMMSPNIGNMGSPMGTAANLNPLMDITSSGYANGNVGNNMGRTPTPTSNMSGGQTIRPSSRTSIDPTLQQQQQQGRPGSAQAQMGTPRITSQSPRPVSAQGQA